MTLKGTDLIVLAALLYAAVSVSQDVFKWTDESGVVHYGDSVPNGIEEFERVTLTPAPAPPAVPATGQAPAATPAARSRTETVTQTPPSSPVVATPRPVSALSLEELDRLCDDARERAIAPLRAQAIAECKATPRNDPGFCERFNADFGEGGRTVSGTMRPRMFDDLPQCVQAQQERNRRGSR